MSEPTIQVIRTTHTIPTPWAKSEDERLAKVSRFRDAVARAEGVVVSERRVRNPAFDRRAERTTFEFVIEWPDR